MKVISRAQEWAKSKVAMVVAIGAAGAVPMAAHAEVPAAVSTALSALSTDAVTVAGLVLAALVAVYAFKFMRKGL